MKITLKNKKIVCILLSVLLLCSSFCIFAFTQNNDDQSNIKVVYKRSSESLARDFSEDTITDFDIKYEIIDAENIKVYGTIEGTPFAVTGNFATCHMDSNDMALEQPNFNYKTIYYTPEEACGNFTVKQFALHDKDSIGFLRFLPEVLEGENENFITLDLMPIGTEEEFIFIYISLDKDIIGPYFENNDVLYSHSALNEYILWILEFAPNTCDQEECARRDRSDTEYYE